MKFYNMKKIDIRSFIHAFAIAFSLSLFLSSCNSDPSKKVKSENLQAVEERSSNDANAPEITFDFDTYDYGEVVDGTQVLQETLQLSSPASPDNSSSPGEFAVIQPNLA